MGHLQAFPIPTGSRLRFRGRENLARVPQNQGSAGDGLACRGIFLGISKKERGAGQNISFWGGRVAGRGPYKGVLRYVTAPYGALQIGCWADSVNPYFLERGDMRGGLTCAQELNSTPVADFTPPGQELFLLVGEVEHGNDASRVD